ncbi:MAG: exo-beta-1,3-glucanase (GH17 family) [Vicingaceae bacterium]|jgi:exo-beta-1,3-glucanase (GH17 family)
MTYSLPKFGVCFGDVDTSYTAADVKAAVGVISKYYNLIRTYDNFHTTDKLAMLMNQSNAYSIDVILGIPNVDLPTFDAANYVKANCYPAGETTPWPSLKCIIVGNETYGVNAYGTYAKDLHKKVAALIAEIKKDPKLDAQVAVSIDFGPALHTGQNVSECDFTGGGDADQNPEHIVNAMNAIINGGLSTPNMVFGNLYPFYAPENNVDLNTAEAMINQLAGTSTGWYPYTAALAALSKNGITDITLNVGETGWSTKDGAPAQTQTTNEARLTMYLEAYKTYIETPSTYSKINKFTGMTSIMFEMFDEPKKTDLAWEPHWGSYLSITPGSGIAPAKKANVSIPFKGEHDL